MVRIFSCGSLRLHLTIPQLTQQQEGFSFSQCLPQCLPQGHSGTSATVSYSRCTTIRYKCARTRKPPLIRYPGFFNSINLLIAVIRDACRHRRPRGTLAGHFEFDLTEIENLILKLSYFAGWVHCALLHVLQQNHTRQENCGRRSANLGELSMIRIESGQWPGKKAIRLDVSRSLPWLFSLVSLKEEVSWQPRSPLILIKAHQPRYISGRSS